MFTGPEGCMNYKSTGKYIKISARPRLQNVDVDDSCQGGAAITKLTAIGKEMKAGELDIPLLRI